MKINLLFFICFAVGPFYSLNAYAGNLGDALRNIGAFEQGYRAAEMERQREELLRQQLEIQRLEIQRRQVELDQQEALRRQIELQRREAEEQARRQSAAKQQAEAAQEKREKEAINTGSGFFVTKDGYFVTNYHVVKDAKTIYLLTIDGQQHKGRIIKNDITNDLSIIKAEGTFSDLPVVSSQKAMRGQSVATIGYPHAAVQGIEPKVTEGIISSLSGVSNDPKIFQISVPIQSGNSGGPLFTKEGNVIGIIVSKLSAQTMLKQTGDVTQNVNYAIKSSYLLDLLKEQRLNTRLSLPKNKTKSWEVITPIVEKATALVVASPIQIDDEYAPNKSSKNDMPALQRKRIPISNQQWELIDENEYRDIFVGKKDFLRHNDHVFADVLINYRSQKGWNNYTYLSSAFEHVINCKSREIGKKGEYYFADIFAKGEVVYSSSFESQMVLTSAGSTDEIIVSKICLLADSLTRRASR